MPYVSPVFAITAPCVGDPVTVGLGSQSTYALSAEAAIATVDATGRKALLRPTAIVRGGGTAFVAGTPVIPSFNTEILDTDNMWTAGSPTIVTINTPGTYLASFIVSSNIISTNTAHRAEILLNGNPISTVRSGPGISGPGAPNLLMVEALARLVATDQISVRVTVSGVGNSTTVPQLSVSLVSY